MSVLLKVYSSFVYGYQHVCVLYEIIVSVFRYHQQTYCCSTCISRQSINHANTNSSLRVQLINREFIQREIDHLNVSMESRNAKQKIFGGVYMPSELLSHSTGVHQATKKRIFRQLDFN